MKVRIEKSAKFLGQKNPPKSFGGKSTSSILVSGRVESRVWIQTGGESLPKGK